MTRKTHHVSVSKHIGSYSDAIEVRLSTLSFFGVAYGCSGVGIKHSHELQILVQLISKPFAGRS